jgi:hypothetical protein
MYVAACRHSVGIELEDTAGILGGENRISEALLLPGGGGAEEETTLFGTQMHKYETVRRKTNAALNNRKK